MWDSKNKMFVLNRYVAFDEASMLRSNFKKVESMKTKAIMQRVDNDVTPRSPVDSVSFGISSNMTPGRDRIASLDLEHVEEKIINLIAVRKTKKNPQ